MGRDNPPPGWAGQATFRADNGHQKVQAPESNQSRLASEGLHDLDDQFSRPVVTRLSDPAKALTLRAHAHRGLFVSVVEVARSVTKWTGFC